MAQTGADKRQRRGVRRADRRERAWEITARPDGNRWFTEINADKIGRVTTAGVFGEFAIPTPASQPNTIRPGPDPNAADDCSYQRDDLGVAGFTERYGNFGGCVSRLATTKTLWFSEQNADRVAQITVDGDVFEFPVRPTSVPGGLTGGPDDAVWIAELSGNRIDRLDVKSVGKPAAPREAGGRAASPGTTCPWRGTRCPRTASYPSRCARRR